jgi:2'-5' RNA ligase
VLERKDPRQLYFHPIYFHITLNELGWQDQLNLEEITTKMKEILTNIEPFILEVKGLNCFNYMIFAQVFDGEEIIFKIDELMHRHFSFIKPRFRTKIPHISITEIKTKEGKNLIELIEKKYRKIEIGEMDVKEIQIVAARPYLTVGALEVVERFLL